jgi:hypothetical protein
MFVKYWRYLLIIFAALTGQLGCKSFWPSENEAIQQLEENIVENPMLVAMIEPDWAMSAVSDELDNYFRIAREERIRIVDGIITEGWIETHTKIGSTYLEPWRSDSTIGFERAHATLQTVRRWAKVRVIPNQNNYLVDVKVYKELEDMADPEFSTVTGRIYRHDNTLDSDRDEMFIAQPNRGWIPMGRDHSLENKILQNIASRFKEKCDEDKSMSSNQ